MLDRNAVIFSLTQCVVGCRSVHSFASHPSLAAVLVAISIPIFTSQLEKSREATDAANIRAAYAEVVSSALTNPDDDASATVTAVQTQADWQNTSIESIRKGCRWQALAEDLLYHLTDFAVSVLLGQETDSF